MAGLWRVEQCARGALLVGTLLAVQAAWAGPVVRVEPSAASDPAAKAAADTDAIQAAFDAAKPGTTIVLAEGRFLVNRMIAAMDFHGTLRGSGQAVFDPNDALVGGTVVTTYGQLPVACPMFDADWGPDHLGAQVLLFSGGQVRMHDLTFRIDDPLPAVYVESETVAGCDDPESFTVPALGAIVFFTGDMKGSEVFRTTFQGAPGYFFGFNVVQATYHEGTINQTYSSMGDPMPGNHRFHDNTVRDVLVGTAVANMAANASLSFTHNAYEGVVEGFEVFDSSGRVSFAQNHVSLFEGDAQGWAKTGVYAMQCAYPFLGIDYFGPLSLVVEDNVIEASPDASAGIDVEDLCVLMGWADASRQNDARVSRNRILLNGDAEAFPYLGIYSGAADGIRILHNRLEGRARWGILADSTAQPHLVLNDLADLVPQMAPIGLAFSWDSLVVTREEPVVDFGDDPSTPENDMGNRVHVPEP